MTATGERRRPHLLGDLGIVIREDGDVLRSTAELVPHMGVPGTDSLRISVLATWADSLLGMVAIGHLAPRLAVTLELDVDLFADVAPVGTLRATGRLVKAGRTVVVTAMEVTDDDGRPVAVSHATFMAAPDPGLTMPGGGWALERFSSRRGVLEEPLALAAGCARLDPGAASLPCAPHLLNSAKLLNGGFIALVVEEAVLSAPSPPVASMSLRYLRPVRLGPATARAEVHGGTGVVEVRDAGSDVLATVATTRPSPGARRDA